MSSKEATDEKVLEQLGMDTSCVAHMSMASHNVHVAQDHDAASDIVHAYTVECAMPFRS